MLKIQILRYMNFFLKITLLKFQLNIRGSLWICTVWNKINGFERNDITGFVLFLAAYIHINEATEAFSAEIRNNVDELYIYTLGITNLLLTKRNPSAIWFVWWPDAVSYTTNTSNAQALNSIPLDPVELSVIEDDFDFSDAEWFSLLLRRWIMYMHIIWN